MLSITSCGEVEGGAIATPSRRHSKRKGGLPAATAWKVAVSLGATTASAGSCFNEGGVLRVPFAPRVVHLPERDAEPVLPEIFGDRAVGVHGLAARREGGAVRLAT